MLNFSKYENMAMLDLQADERELVEKRLVEITQHFSKLDKYDTSDTLPLVSVLDLHNIMREDVPKKTTTRDELMSNAPEHNDGYFVVPETI